VTSGTTSPPEWAVSDEEAASAMAAWASQHRLRYERTGLLPAASEYLTAGLGQGIDGWRKSMVQTKGVPGGRIQFYDDRKERPVRFSENLCSGILPGRLTGTLAHHSGIYETAGEHGARLLHTTAVVAPSPDGRRVVRELTGQARAKGSYVIGSDLEKPARELSYDKIELPPSLGGRSEWTVWKYDDKDAVAVLFDPELVEAIERAPEHRSVTLRDGMLVVEANGYLTDPADLDALLRPACLLAERLRAAAGRLRPLAPGEALPPPADTPLRRWVTEQAARVSWTDPPPDVPTAINASRDSRIKPPGFVARRLRKALAPMASGPSDPLPADQVGGFEAFVAAYADARRYEPEDPDELRRRVTFPFPGLPQACLRGYLGGSVPGRIVLWRDGTDVGERCFLNLALVQPPAGAAASATAQAPFAVSSADGWLVVSERVDQAGRSLVRLDALAAEAARIAAT
jgi:hypothetical protein